MVVSLWMDHTRASTAAVSSVHNACCWQDGRPTWSSNIYDDKPDDDDNYDAGGLGAGEKSVRRRQELAPLGDDVPYRVTLRGLHIIDQSIYLFTDDEVGKHKTTCDERRGETEPF